MKNFNSFRNKEKQNVKNVHKYLKFLIFYRKFAMNKPNWKLNSIQNIQIELFPEKKMNRYVFLCLTLDLSAGFTVALLYDLLKCA